MTSEICLEGPEYIRKTPDASAQRLSGRTRNRRRMLRIERDPWAIISRTEDVIVQRCYISYEYPQVMVSVKPKRAVRYTERDVGCFHPALANSSLRKQCAVCHPVQSIFVIHRRRFLLPTDGDLCDRPTKILVSDRRSFFVSDRRRFLLPTKFFATDGRFLLSTVYRFIAILAGDKKRSDFGLQKTPLNWGVCI